MEGLKTENEKDKRRHLRIKKYIEQKKEEEETC